MLEQAAVAASTTVRRAPRRLIFKACIRALSALKILKTSRLIANAKRKRLKIAFLDQIALQSRRLLPKQLCF
jgi:hypothetical protein